MIFFVVTAREATWACCRSRAVPSCLAHDDTRRNGHAWLQHRPHGAEALFGNSDAVFDFVRIDVASANLEFEMNTGEHRRVLTAALCRSVDIEVLYGLSCSTEQKRNGGSTASRQANEQHFERHESPVLPQWLEIVDGQCERQVPLSGESHLAIPGCRDFDSR